MDNKSFFRDGYTIIRVKPGTWRAGFTRWQESNLLPDKDGIYYCDVEFIGIDDEGRLVPLVHDYIGGGFAYRSMEAAMQENNRSGKIYFTRLERCMRYA